MVMSGHTKKEADDNSCRRVFAILLVRDASRVVLRPAHWRCTVAELVADIGAILQRQQQPLAVPHSRTGRSSQTVNPDVGKTLTILYKCLDYEGGECDPSHFMTHPDGFKPWLALDGLLQPGSLRGFLEAHRFQVLPKPDGKGFTFRPTPVHSQQPPQSDAACSQ